MMEHYTKMSDLSKEFSRMLDLIVERDYPASKMSPAELEVFMDSVCGFARCTSFFMDFVIIEARKRAEELRPIINRANKATEN